MKRVPQLDAIRGLAVLMVLIHNTDKYPSLHLGIISKDGWMGVDLFFALSGFLITGILLDAKGLQGYFRNFYVRRCLRIWPLYYAILIFMFVVVPLVRPSEAHRIFEPRSMPWWSYLIFVQNFLVPVVTKATGSLGVTWSLAVEEQFYLVWPWIVYFCSEAQLRKIAISVVCLSPILRYYLWHRGFDIYPNTFCRLDGLMAGALVAMILRSSLDSRQAYVRPAWALFLVAAPMALVTNAYNVRWIAFSFTAVASASLVCLALCSEQRWLRAVMTNRFLVYTGTISYGIYLIEKIAPDAAQSLHLDRHPALIMPFTALVTYLAAIASWHLLEKPFLHLKRFFETPAKLRALPETPAVGAA